MNMQLIPFGDSAVLVQFDSNVTYETHQKVRELAARLQHQPFQGMIEYVPAYTTVAIYYNSLKLSYTEVCSELAPIISDLENTVMETPRTIKIPVCYGGGFGPDLEVVAIHNNLTMEEVVQIHSERDYLVYMIGFAPGFPYLGGMSERIQTPRRLSPRLVIPAGSVGIAGRQTGVYPIETPGGWQLIGRTPKVLFRPNDRSPSLLQAGDIVRFYPISRSEYDQWKGTV